MDFSNSGSEYEKDGVMCLVDFDYDVRFEWNFLCIWVCRDCARDFLYCLLVNWIGFRVLCSGYDGLVGKRYDWWAVSIKYLILIMKMQAFNDLIF